MSRFRRLLHDQSVEFDGDEFVSMQRVSINGLYDVLNGQVLAVYARDQQIFIIIGSASLSLAELGAEVRMRTSMAARSCRYSNQASSLGP
jgi:hypothetical protein